MVITVCTVVFVPFSSSFSSSSLSSPPSSCSCLVLLVFVVFLLAYILFVCGNKYKEEAGRQAGKRDEAKAPRINGGYYRSAVVEPGGWAAVAVVVFAASVLPICCVGRFNAMKNNKEEKGSSYKSRVTVFRFSL